MLAEKSAVRANDLCTDRAVASGVNISGQRVGFPIQLAHTAQQAMKWEMLSIARGSQPSMQLQQLLLVLTLLVGGLALVSGKFF